MDGQASISPQNLHGVIGTAAAPIVIDVCGDIAFDADDRMLYAWCRACQGETHNWTPGAKV